MRQTEKKGSCARIDADRMYTSSQDAEADGECMLMKEKTLDGQLSIGKPYHMYSWNMISDGSVHGRKMNERSGLVALCFIRV